MIFGKDRAEQLADFGFEIVAVDGIDLGCDLQRNPTTFGYPDRPITVQNAWHPTKNAKSPA